MVKYKPVALECSYFTGRTCCLCFSSGKFTCLVQASIVCVWMIISSLPQLYIFLWTTTLRDPPLQRSKSESVYRDPVSNKTHLFPLTAATPPTIYLSLVAPAYKEQDRCESLRIYTIVFSEQFIYIPTVPKMLEETMEYLEKRQKSDPSFTYEVVVVNDGSPDYTSQVSYIRY